MIETIVFDLGGVLVDWNPRYVYKDVFVSEDTMEYFLSNICTNHWNEQQDAGRSFEEATNLLIAEYPHYETEIKMYYGCWCTMLKGSIEETVELLRQLKSSEKFRLLALTNWAAESFPVALDRFEFLHWFEGILVSGEEKLKKPDPAIFKLMISRYDLDVNKTLFIDDNAANIQAAKKLGFNVVHFTSTQKSIDEILAIIK